MEDEPASEAGAEERLTPAMCTVIQAVLLAYEVGDMAMVSQLLADPVLTDSWVYRSINQLDPIDVAIAGRHLDGYLTLPAPRTAQ